MKIFHPFYVPAVDPVDLTGLPVEALTVNAALQSGIDAQVILPGRPDPDKLVLYSAILQSGRTTDLRVRPVKFSVAIRELAPGPRLTARDAQVAAWVEAQGWGAALMAAEQRWNQLYSSGELVKHARAVAGAAELEAERRRAVDAAAPGFWDEVVNQYGELAAALAAAVNGVGKVLAIGLGAWLAVKVVRAIRD